MKTFATGVILTGLLAAAGCSPIATPPASAGPKGGDLVPIKGGTAYAELLANADTGEVMVNTWDKDLKTRRPIEKEPITVGGGDHSVELTPHPMDTDPAGTCSRFYGEASWVRGGGIRHGWLHGGGTGGHHDFDWSHCWQGGQVHGPMWEEMGPHRRMGQGHMPGGPGHGPGHEGGRDER
jgi:hypothetical protein